MMLSPVTISWTIIMMSTIKLRDPIPLLLPVTAIIALTYTLIQHTIDNLKQPAAFLSCSSFRHVLIVTEFGWVVPSGKPGRAAGTLPSNTLPGTNFCSLGQGQEEEISVGGLGGLIINDGMQFLRAVIMRSYYYCLIMIKIVKK